MSETSKKLGSTSKEGSKIGKIYIYIFLSFKRTLNYKTNRSRKQKKKNFSLAIWSGVVGKKKKFPSPVSAESFFIY